MKKRRRRLPTRSPRVKEVVVAKEKERWLSEGKNVEEMRAVAATAAVVREVTATAIAAAAVEAAAAAAGIIFNSYPMLLYVIGFVIMY